MPVAKPLPKNSTSPPAPHAADCGDPDNASFRAGDPDFMTSLARGLHVIRSFAGADRRLTIADVSRATGLTRAVVRRCLYTLSELGYVATEGRGFFLQPRVLNLGFAYLSGAGLPIAAQPVLEELSRSTGEACSVAVLDAGTVVCVARAATRPLVSVTYDVGSRLPAYCTAPGRILLAQLDDGPLAGALTRVDFVARTRYTVASRTRLEQLIRSVRSEGFALDDQELEMGWRSIAVPVRNGVGAIPAAMNVSAQVTRLSCKELLEQVLPELRAAAQRLGGQL